MNQSGSIAANFHEGSRSEYLAQYLFSSFGTSVPVPHQEDAGIDMYCTITERVGRLEWPIVHYTVQVKSADGAWVFASEDSVRWLLAHPLPLFLCVIDKKDARLRVYQTSPRLLFGHGDMPEEVTLTPERITDGVAFKWTPPAAVSLSAPIVDFTVSQLLNEANRKLAGDCIKRWAQIDAANIRRRANGLNVVEMPSHYKTNEVPVPGATGTMFAKSGAGSKAALVELLKHLGRDHGFFDTDKLTATLIDMLHRNLTRQDDKTIMSVEDMLNKRLVLNQRIAAASYHFAAVDYLVDTVRDAIADPSGKGP